MSSSDREENLRLLERMRAEGWEIVELRRPRREAAVDYDWEFIADPDARDQCDYVYPEPELRPDPITGAPNFYRTPYKRKRCIHDGKFQKGDEIRCGVHTPGVGVRGRRRVPKDPKEN